MNELYRKYQLGLISNHDLNYKIKLTQFEKLVENPRTKIYHTNRSIPKDSSSDSISHTFNRITCLDLDTFDQGKYLLSGHDDGSISLWFLDGKLDGFNDELMNERLNYSRRLIDARTRPPQKGCSVNTSPTLLCSTETKFNKFRMYIGNNSAKKIKLDTLDTTDHGSHQYGITTVKWYGPDNGMFFTGGNDSMIKIWDTNEFTTVEEINFNYKINQIDCLADTPYIVVASEDRYPRIIDLKTLNMGISILDSRDTIVHGDRSEIMSCKINPKNSNIIACGDSDGRIKIWDIRKGNQLLNELMKNDIRQRAHTRCCNDLIWIRNGDQIVSIGLDGKIVKWDPFDNNIYTNEFNDNENMNYFTINNSNPTSEMLTLITRNYKGIGDIDMMRNRYKKRVSKRLELIEDKYLIVVTDYGELQIFDIKEGKYWNKIDIPIEYNMGKKYRGQFTGIAVQQNMTNSRGLRLLVGTSTTHLKENNIQVLGDCPLIEYSV